MWNATLGGGCPAPFYSDAKFPEIAGSTDLRFCAPLNVLQPGSPLTCCIPCPVASFIYPPRFVMVTRIAEGLNALGIVFCVLMLFSYALLPAEKTRRHYINVCLTIAIAAKSLGEVIGLAVGPDPCFDAITPNDMASSMPCAWSGAFNIFGGLTIAIWITIRTVSMHLQICWDIVPGKKFFYISQAGGWGLSVLFFVLTMVFTGTSFRLGDACHVKPKNSLKVYWGPLLGLAGIAALAQLSTFVYCVNVYLQNIWSNSKSTPETSTDLPSYNGSINSFSAKAVWRRVRKVIFLQWRSIMIAVILVAQVIFFSFVFVWLDQIIEKLEHDSKFTRTGPWILCLLQHGGPADECYKLGQDALINEDILLACLFLLGLAGTECLILTGRWGMLTGWSSFFQDRIRKRREFVSLDARHGTPQLQQGFGLYRSDSNHSSLASEKSTVQLLENVVIGKPKSGRSNPEYIDYDQHESPLHGHIIFSQPFTCDSDRNPRRPARRGPIVTTTRSKEFAYKP